MSRDVEIIKERLGIADVVGSYLKIEKAGNNMKAKCPFHNEKTPSFFISPDRGTYYCFGCGAKGDIFSFVQEFEGIDFLGALKILADRAGVTLSRGNNEDKTEKERLRTIIEKATIFFQRNLSGNTKILEYLKSRGLSTSTISIFRIGYSFPEWRGLYDYLKKDGISESDMLKAGLIKKSDNGFYDTFRGRVMFPISDTSGRVIAFSGRIVEDDGKSPKYLNTPDTILFDKSSVLYGLDKAKSEIRKRDYTILVEGQMDLLMSHQIGFTNTVAVSGTALTDTLLSKENVINNLGLINRLSKNIIISLDSDEAGFKASQRSAQIALSLGMDVKMAKIPKGMDPADTILKDKNLWKKIIMNSEHVVDFYVNSLLDKNLDERKLGKEIEKNVLPYVLAMRSSIDQSHFISKIAEKTGIKEDALWEELKKVKVNEDVELANQDQNKPEILNLNKVGNSIERRIFGIIFWQEKNENSTVSVSDLKEKIKKIIGEDKFKQVENLPIETKNELSFEAEVYYENYDFIKRDVDEMMLNFELDRLKEEFEKTMKNLVLAEKKKDESSMKVLMEKCHE
ncbi:DNA primase, partial [Candidatus Nomurabacteria bacterium]|nr:DNA primase [Candidatus Nomurabacteria bacterium]